MVLMVTRMKVVCLMIVVTVFEQSVLRRRGGRGRLVVIGRREGATPRT